MATNIILIRHAEKPSDNPLVAGVTESGRQDPEELTVRGWQRAGALVTLFAPRSGHFADARLAAPDVIFASGIAPHSKSLRSQHTVLPLSKMLVKAIDLSHPKGDEEGLVNDVLGANGVVLVAWEHEAIPRIANQILGNDRTCPQTWSANRFDVAWLFDRLLNGSWSFAQVPQMLLPDDIAEPI